MTRVKMLLVMLTAVLGAAGGTWAAAAAVISPPPPVTAPPGTVGPFYSGPVHECVSAGNESVAYFELYSTARGNCAPGYRQLAVNELTPSFTLQLGTAAYQCTAATAQQQTALSCTAASSPASSSSSSGG